ncbi:MAG: putative acyl-CoA dehydrogenase, partial [Pseudonocardiales bacterium]|nr:putative acyl-CoA dehydrogenase [Pseudonocardiales bacterium]
MLQDAARAFLTDKGGVHAARELLDTPDGYDRVVWTQLARDFGLQGLAVPEGLGGGGFSFADLAVVLEEMGRVLFCGPFLATAVLAVEALRASGDDAVMNDVLPGISAGELVATLAVGGAAPRGWYRGSGVHASLDVSDGD